MAREYARTRKRKLRLLCLPADNQRPDFREVHFLDRDRLQIRLRKEAGEIEIRLEPDVHGKRRDGPLEPRENRVGVAEVDQDDDLSAWLADAAHFLDDLHRIRHDADEVRRIDDIKRIVGEDEMRGIHLMQTNMTESLTLDPLAGLLQHRCR